MAQYIDKSALVAEIERLYKAHSGKHGCDEVGLNLEYLKDFLDTLEVKDVDLDSERRKYLTEHFNVYEDGILQSKRSNLPLDTYDVIKLAKHFFELGIKAQKGEKV